MKDHWVPDTYADTTSYASDLAIELINSASLQNVHTVLDVGCGEGRTTYDISKLFPDAEIIGTDISENMISYATEKYRHNKNLTFKVMSAENLNFSTTTKFDLVTSIFCMQWVKDKLLAFKNISQLLNAHGSFLSISPKRHDIFHKLVPPQMFATAAWKPYFTGYSDPTVSYEDINFKEYAHLAGLKIHMYNEQLVVIKFNSREDLAGTFTNILPYHSQLPTETLKNAFINEFVDRYLSVVKPDSQGHCITNNDLITFQLTKT